MRMRCPTTPNNVIRTRSNALPFTAYTATKASAATPGIKNHRGRVSARTKIPTKGRLKSSKNTLPTYIEAARPQKMSGCS